MARKLLGYAPVDSGQIMLIDPCYVLDTDEDERQAYAKVCCSHTVGCDHSRDTEGFLGDNTFHKGFGGAFDVTGGGQRVVTGTGFGDGSYPVYAEISDEGDFGKRVKSVTIVFIDEDY